MKSKSKQRPARSYGVSVKTGETHMKILRSLPKHAPKRFSSRFWVNVRHGRSTNMMRDRRPRGLEYVFYDEAPVLFNGIRTTVGDVVRNGPPPQSMPEIAPYLTGDQRERFERSMKEKLDEMNWYASNVPFEPLANLMLAIPVTSAAVDETEPNMSNYWPHAPLVDEYGSGFFASAYTPGQLEAARKCVEAQREEENEDK